MTQYIDKYALVAEIERIKNTEYNGNSISDDVACCALDMVIDAINTLEAKEEEKKPVNNDLNDIASQLAQKYFPNENNIWARPNIEAQDCKNACIEMAKWQKEHLWKPADGDDLPEYEREVIVFTQSFPNDAGIMSVAIGHRPNPDGWNGKSLSTGKVEHFTPKTYGKGGWNIPDVVLWLDYDINELLCREK